MRMCSATLENLHSLCYYLINSKYEDLCRLLRLLNLLDCDIMIFLLLVSYESIM